MLVSQSSPDADLLNYRRSAGLCSEDEERLVRDLFRGYNKLIRPVQNMTEKVHVNFGLAFVQLINVVSILDGYSFDFVGDGICEWVVGQGVVLQIFVENLKSYSLSIFDISWQGCIVVESFSGIVICECCFMFARVLDGFVVLLC